MITLFDQDGKRAEHLKRCKQSYEKYKDDSAFDREFPSMRDAYFAGASTGLYHAVKMLEEG